MGWEIAAWHSTSEGDKPPREVVALVINDVMACPPEVACADADPLLPVPEAWAMAAPMLPLEAVLPPVAMPETLTRPVPVAEAIALAAPPRPAFAVRAAVPPAPPMALALAATD